MTKQGRGSTGAKGKIVPQKEASAKAVGAIRTTRELRETREEAERDIKKRHIAAVEIFSAYVRKLELTPIGEAMQAVCSAGEFRSADSIDAADLERHVALLGAKMSSQRALFKALEEAQARVRSGTYGTCSDCGGAIDLKRLEIVPLTTLCVDCKTDHETTEKAMKHHGRQIKD